MCAGLRSSAAIIAATIEGGGDVCPQPVGSAMSRPEMSANRCGMKSARGARSSARKRPRSLIPFARIASVNWARSSCSVALIGAPRPPDGGSLILPPRKRLLEPQARIVVRQVEPERRNRDFLRRQGRQIGPVLMLIGAALEHEP